MVDSKFTEYGSANTETGFAKHDTQLAASVPAKKTTPLRDLQNGNQNMVPKYLGSSPFPKETGPANISGTKRPTPECLASSPHQQSPTSTAVNGRLVYVRRKPEAELGKSSTSGSTSNNVNCPQPRKLGDQSDGIMQQSQMTDSRVSMPESVPVWRASSVGVSSGKPSVPLLPGKLNNKLQPADSDYHPITLSEYPKKTNALHWEERFCRLQNLLKILDQSVHAGYFQMLQSLSSVDLSRLAVELEKRSIQLSLEEVKEMQRVRHLDVLGKCTKNPRAPSTQQNQSEK